MLSIPTVRPWRSRLPSWLAPLRFARHLKHGFDGHLLHQDVSGHLINACPEGCPCSGSCFYCDADPSCSMGQVHVTFTDVNLCGCVVCSGASEGVTGALGTYTLTTSNGCGFALVTSSVRYFSDLTDEDCIATEYIDGLITLSKAILAGTSGWRLSVFGDQSAGCVFDSFLAGDWPTSRASRTFTNYNTSCDCSGQSPFGTFDAVGSGGTAVVTPC